MTGTIEIGSHHFKYVSGGRGWSIPYGDWLITPDEVGTWGEKRKAIGINHDDPMYDPQIHRNRYGIEIHRAIDDNTGGCVGIISGYPVFRRLVLAMVEKDGKVWLHVHPDGIMISSRLT